MAFYIILLLLASAASFCHSFSKNIYASYIFKALTFLLLFIPAALRHGIGYDWPGYENFFKQIALGRPIVIDVGFYYLYLFVTKLGLTFQAFISLIAFITLFLYFISFQKKYFYLCVPLLVMFTYLWIFTTLRQMLASAIIYFAYTRCYTKKRYLWSIILLIAGIFIHSSTVIYVVFPALFLLRVDKKKAVVIFFGIIMCYFYATPILDFFYQFIISKTRFRYYYYNFRWGEPNITTGFTILIRVLIYTAILIAISDENKKETSRALVLFLSMIFFDFLSLKIDIINRLARGLLFSYYPIISQVENGRSKYRTICLSFVFLMAFAFFSAVLIRDGYGSRPYISIFNRY
jgi:hypothetical protein